jgi:hypothetical protein
MAAVPIERRKSCGVVIASFMVLGGAALLHWPALVACACSLQLLLRPSVPTYTYRYVLEYAV